MEEMPGLKRKEPPTSSPPLLPVCSKNRKIWWTTDMDTYEDLTYDDSKAKNDEVTDKEQKICNPSYTVEQKNKQTQEILENIVTRLMSKEKYNLFRGVSVENQESISLQTILEKIRDLKDDSIFAAVKDLWSLQPDNDTTKDGKHLLSEFHNELEAAEEECKGKLNVCCLRVRYKAPFLGCDICERPVAEDEKYFDYSDQCATWNVCVSCYNATHGKMLEFKIENTTWTEEEQTLPPTPGIRKLQKSIFLAKKHVACDMEQTVTCTTCGQEFHQICVNFVKDLTTQTYVCSSCAGVYLPPKSGICDVSLLPPKTKLSESIETCVNAIIQDPAEYVYVRSVSITSNVMTLQENVKEFLKEFLDPAEKYPYTSRALMCFQASDKGFVAFFVAYFQEFDANCPPPNTNTVYISMIDSAHLYKPAKKRTKVFYTTVLTYINFIRSQGFSSVFLWSCPPRPGFEYVFNRRPKSQKAPTPEMLQDWYSTLMTVGMDTNILENCGSLLDWCPKNPADFFRQFPYFPEDHWSNELDKAICAYEKAVSSSQQKSGRGRPSKTGSRKSSKLLHTDKRSFVFHEMMSAIRAHEKNFFWMGLKGGNVNERSLVKNYIQLPFSTVADSRDDLVKFFRDNNLEFSDIRNAQFSTTALLNKLKNGNPIYYSIFCDICTRNISQEKFRMYCNDCKTNFCVLCVIRRGFTHEHVLKLIHNKSNPCLQKNTGEDPSVSTEEHSKWKQDKQDWWPKFKAEAHAGNEMALKILCHVKKCEEKVCQTCMRFRDLGYFQLSTNRPQKLTSSKPTASANLLDRARKGVIENTATDVVSSKPVGKKTKTNKLVTILSRAKHGEKILKRTDKLLTSLANLDLDGWAGTTIPDIRQRQICKYQWKSTPTWGARRDENEMGLATGVSLLSPVHGSRQ